MRERETRRYPPLCELSAWREYTRSEQPLHFWRTRDGQEVDFVRGDSVGIEEKSTRLAGARDTLGLRRLNGAEVWPWSGEFGDEHR